jgi:glycosyltransferase involved in cell wall biosynthesis
MKVALVVPGFSTDASDWCIPALRHLVARMTRSAEVHIFALRYPNRRRHYELFGARVTALAGGEARAGRSALVWQRTATALLAENGRTPFDVIHAFWAGEPGFVAALIGRALGIPTVVSIAGGELAGLRDIGYGGLLRRLERMKIRIALGLASAVTAGSALAAASANRFMGRRSTFAARRIPLGVDLAMFSPTRSRQGDRVARIVHVASLCGVKDQVSLLSAAAALQDRGHAFRLEMVGAGPLEGELRALAGCLGIGDTIRWRGSVPHDEMPSEYRSADLFALTSRHEAQGMAALEAAACGLPIVGTQVGVIPELAPAAARISSVGDSEGVAEGMAEFVADERSRTNAGRAAREMADAEYSLDRCAGRFLELYREVGARSRGGRA